MKRFNIGYILVVVFILFCVGLIGCGAYYEYDYHKKVHNFEGCKGKITSYETRKESENIKYAPVYKYNIDSENYTIQGDFVSRKPTLGESVTIYYNPENPADALCAEEHSKAGIITILICLGILILYIGISLAGTGFEKIPLIIGGLLLLVGIFIGLSNIVAIIFIGIILVGIWFAYSTYVQIKGPTKKKAQKMSERLQDTIEYLKEDNRGINFVHIIGSIFSILYNSVFLILGVIALGTVIICLFTMERVTIMVNLGVFILFTVVGLTFTAIGIKKLIPYIRSLKQKIRADRE